MIFDLLPQERFKIGHEHTAGIKMTAHSPVRPISPYSGQCIEVTQYQPPWQALNDFAMNSNFDSDHMDTNNPEYKRLFHQVSSKFGSDYIIVAGKRLRKINGSLIRWLFRGRVNEISSFSGNHKSHLHLMRWLLISLQLFALFHIVSGMSTRFGRV